LCGSSSASTTTLRNTKTSIRSSSTSTTTLTTSSSASSSSSSLRRRHLQTVKYEPWPNGTPVYWKFPNEGWWKGTITNFEMSTGMYTITWEDNSKDYYDNWNQIDQMVAYAQNDPSFSATDAPTTEATTSLPPPTDHYPVGTKVGLFESGQWWVGTVVDYSGNKYTIRWDSDAEVERLAPGDVMDQMVADAAEAMGAKPNGMWKEGTPVAEYEDGQWWYGTISSYDSDSGYTVAWDDGETESYSDLDFVNQMVSDAETQGATTTPTEEVTDAVRDQGDQYPVGTAVYKEFDDGWWVGHIESQYRNEYAVRWSDGSVDTYVEGPEMDQMVNDAVNIPSTQSSSSSGLSQVGKTFTVTMLIVILVSLLAFVAIKQHQKKKQAKAAEEQAASPLEEPREENIVAYRDEPADDTPKII